LSIFFVTLLLLYIFRESIKKSIVSLYSFWVVSHFWNMCIGGNVMNVVIDYKINYDYTWKIMGKFRGKRYFPPKNLKMSIYCQTGKIIFPFGHKKNTHFEKISGKIQIFPRNFTMIFPSVIIIILHLDNMLNSCVNESTILSNRSYA